MPNLSFYERQHIQRLIEQEGSLNLIFDVFSRRTSQLLTKWSDSGNSSVWVRNGGIEKEIEKELTDLHSRLSRNINDFSIDGWERSNLKTDDLISAFIKDMPLSKTVRDGLSSRNLEALSAFQNRKMDNLTISDRIWKTTGIAKENIEHYLQSGLSTGRSANLISQDLRQLLANPDKRFHRIRNDEGKLIPSAPMAAYTPGPGKYRSSYMNAKRLAATETNMAYRAADCERWKNLGFVLGIEVRRSNSAKGPCPICDPLVGKYPKDFKYWGWHPFCICVATPILMKEDDFINYLNDGNLPKGDFIQDIPSEARDYMEGKLKDGKVSLNSYLFSDNKKYFLHFVEKPEIGSQPTASMKLHSDVTGFVTTINSIISSTQNNIAKREIIKLKADKELDVTFTNPDTGRQILKHSYTKPLDHEFVTAKKLTDVDFDVIFAPKSMFGKKDKKFDVFILSDVHITKADLKANFTPKSNAIYKSLESGAGQAKNIVIDINSKIGKDELIDGLRNGVKDFPKIKKVLLFYRKKYHELDRRTIFSKSIYRLLE